MLPVFCGRLIRPHHPAFALTEIDEVGRNTALRPEPIRQLERPVALQGYVGLLVLKFAEATLLPLLLFLAGIVSLSQTQSAPAAAEAVQVTGLTDIKENAKNTLTVENGTFTFATSKSSCDVSVASIQDVVTRNDSQRVISGTVGTLTTLARTELGGRSVSYETRSTPLRFNIGIQTAAFTGPSLPCRLARLN